MFFLSPSVKQFQFMMGNYKCPGSCQLENSVLDLLSEYLDELDKLWVGVKDKHYLAFSR